ncbi:Glycosyl hydrolase family 26 [Ruminococcaceae bacterium YRB3002]|nr:Glycosyl hydrolase family 26 [Ruminococcaceae bacterium YRB3002]
MKDGRQRSVNEMLDVLRNYTDRSVVLLGHQNAGHIGVAIDVKDGTDSDIKRLTGKMPAVVGVDTLSFLGYEGRMNDLIKVVKNLHKQGIIVTLSSHMPNFTMGGPDTYYDYSPNNTLGNCGRRIMPGGDLNDKFNHFLDLIAEFAEACVDIKGEPIPMIFRPFHECNGDWFWWGSPYLTDKEYISLYRYTVSYLEACGVTSFAYCYSPNGPVTGESQFMARYPGDDAVDVIGFDYYHDRPSEGDGFFTSLDTSLGILCRVAESHNVIPALTEIGARLLDSSVDYYEGLAPSGNPEHWFTDLGKIVTGHRIAYLLFWANFSSIQYWVPYDRSHELAEDFIAMVSDKGIGTAPAFDNEGCMI